MTIILAVTYPHAMTAIPLQPLNIYDPFVRHHAEQHGDRRALLTDRGETTYGELHELAGRYATLLQEVGLKPTDRVLIALPDGVDYVGALFGILRAGAVVVMVNPQLKSDQTSYFLDYTTPTVALVHTEVFDEFSAAATELSAPPVFLEVGTESFSERLSSASPEPAFHPTLDAHAAMFLFSGGTTGNPKAVVQSHRSFLNTTKLYGQGTLGLTEDDVTLSVPKLFFGYATGSNLFFPLYAGATAALFPERCTTEAFFRRIEQFQPTVLINVPTMVNNLLGTEEQIPDLAGIRLSTSAGEALPVELHRKWEEQFGIPLLDGLGTAEMWHIFISNRPDDVRPGTLGRVVDGFDVRSCDLAGNDVPDGEMGIMRVRGDSLAIGYWQDDEKTRDAFQGEWYVSSDMISIDADGYVTYGGRADDMLKVSGKWLSPQELENCLLEHDSVREAAVVGVKTPDGLVKPSAFVILNRDFAASGDLAVVLQDWAKSRLEPYKYPRDVTFMTDLPRTHLGKVDRGKLSRGEGRSSDETIKVLSDGIETADNLTA